MGARDIDGERRPLGIVDEPVVLRSPYPHLLGQFVVVLVSGRHHDDPSGAADDECQPALPIVSPAAPPTRYGRVRVMITAVSKAGPGAVRSGGIDLTGLTKTFRTKGGPVHAVRGIDISIAPGET